MGEKSMLKKVVLGTVFAVFIGALITGAVIRTMDKSHQTTTEVRAGGGNDRNTSLENTSNTENQGNGQGRGRSTEDQDQARGGKGSEGSRVLTEEESDHLWEAYSGIVIEVSEEIVTIETREGEWIVVEGRAWSYAQEQGYYMQQGDQVQFEGFYENGEFKVSKLENLTTGESIVIRDASGRPSWAGGGWGNL
jgi:hypothetical protein